MSLRRRYGRDRSECSFGVLFQGSHARLERCSDRFVGTRWASVVARRAAPLRAVPLIHRSGTVVVSRRCRTEVNHVRRGRLGLHRRQGNPAGPTATAAALAATATPMTVGLGIHPTPDCSAAGCHRQTAGHRRSRAAQSSRRRRHADRWCTAPPHLRSASVCAYCHEGPGRALGAPPTPGRPLLRPIPQPSRRVVTDSSAMPWPTGLSSGSACKGCSRSPLADHRGHSSTLTAVAMSATTTTAYCASSRPETISVRREWTSLRRIRGTARGGCAGATACRRAPPDRGWGGRARWRRG
jgi:hypothetical protein